MYDATDPTTGKNKYIVAQIAAEFGVTRPTIYRYLDLDLDLDLSNRPV